MRLPDNIESGVDMGLIVLTNLYSWESPAPLWTLIESMTVLNILWQAVEIVLLQIHSRLSNNWRADSSNIPYDILLSATAGSRKRPNLLHFRHWDSPKEFKINQKVFKLVGNRSNNVQTSWFDSFSMAWSLSYLLWWVVSLIRLFWVRAHLTTTRSSDIALQWQKEYSYHKQLNWNATDSSK